MKTGRLLIIDDEEELRLVLAALLEDSVAEIVEAANGAEGIERLKSGQFDAVLSDEKMPKKTGLEVLEWMRAQGIKTPFIIHTGYGNQETYDKAKALGVYALIEKPWNENHLLRTVAEALNSTQTSK